MHITTSSSVMIPILIIQIHKIQTGKPIDLYKRANNNFLAYINLYNTWLINECHFKPYPNAIQTIFLLCSWFKKIIIASTAGSPDLTLSLNHTQSKVLPPNPQLDPCYNSKLNLHFLIHERFASFSPPYNLFISNKFKQLLTLSTNFFSNL